MENEKLVPRDPDKTYELLVEAAEIMASQQKQIVELKEWVAKTLDFLKKIQERYGNIDL